MSNSNTDIILAGATAAFTIDLLVYPLDTIKTRYQSQDYLKTFSESTSSSATTKAARSTVFRGLYQGVGSVIVATLPAAGLFFTTYESSKTLYSRLLNGIAVPVPIIHSLASGTAELASCLVLTPAEVIKQNAQMIRSSSTSTSQPTLAGTSSSSWKNSTSVQALRKISQGNGAAGAANRLLTGYTTLIARNLPFTALQFPIFESLRQRLWEARRQHDSPSKLKVLRSGETMAHRLLETGWVNGVSAAVSGAIAAVATTPADVAKTRMMLYAGEEGHSSPADASQGAARQKKKKLSGLQTAQLVYRERGAKGLFRGGWLRAGWTALGSGLYLGTYETAKVWLRGTADGEDEGL